MGPLIMIHAWVHLSASLQPPLTTLTAGHSITSDSVSPICVTGTKTYDSPPQPTARCLKSLISPPRGVVTGTRGTRGEVASDVSDVHDAWLTSGWPGDDDTWSLAPLTSHRDPAEISTWHDGHWDSRTPRAGIIFHRNWKWFLALPHSFYYPWPGSSHPPGVIQLVHNHNERRDRVTHHTRTGTREGK